MAPMNCRSTSRRPAAGNPAITACKARSGLRPRPGDRLPARSLPWVTTTFVLSCPVALANSTIASVNHRIAGLFVLLTAGEAIAQVTLTRGPYLQNGSPTSVVVRWRTDLPTDSRVQYGTTPNNLNLVASRVGVTTEHEVRLTGLTPDTRYHYSVGDGLSVLSTGPDHFFL